MSKKRKKSKESDSKSHKDGTLEDVILTSVTTMDTFMEETQYTDTSYTSASLETLPTPPLKSEMNIKVKRKKRKRTESTMHPEKSESLWSSDIFSDDTPQPKPVEEVKKKKGKKKEKNKDEVPMPKFEKPKNWKKMSAKEKSTWTSQRMEQYKQEMEAERVAAAAGAKEMKIQRLKERNELAAKEVVMQNVRRDILAKICNLFAKHERLRREHDFKDMLEMQWKNYIKCNGLPDPTSLPQLNSYLNQWDSATYHDCTEHELSKRYSEVMPTLDQINFYTQQAVSTLSPEKIQDILKARTELQNQLMVSIERTCFNILRELDKIMTYESTKTAWYHKELQGMNLNVWVAIKQPTRLKTKDDVPPDPVTLDLPDLNLRVVIPPVVNITDICVRISHCQTDLCSPIAKSYNIAVDMPHKDEDLFTFNVKEFIYINKIGVEYDEMRAKFYKDTAARIKELEKFIKANAYLKNEKEKEELEELHVAEPPVLLGEQNPRLRIIKENDDAMRNFMNACNYRCKPEEMDLRRERICGGVYYIDLFETPPQSKYIRYEVYLSTLILPNVMKGIIYHKEYKPLPPENPNEPLRHPSVIRLEKEKNNAEHDQLAIVELTLPQNVIWLEQPKVCQWNQNDRLWTSKHIYDVEWNRIECTMQFRTGVFWPIGFAAFRYSNMPYKDWDLRKDPAGKGVLFTLTGIHVTVKILCRNRRVVLKEISDTGYTALDEYVDKAMTVAQLKRVFQEAGVDLFPDFDAHNFVKKTCPKTWVPERHLYHAMAFLSKAFNFKFSKWNNRVGTRYCVCQIREHTDKRRENKFELLLSSPEKACLLKYGENMDEYCDEPQLGQGFYPDLFALNLSYGSREARKRVFGMSHKMTETVFDLLQEMKPLSFA